MEPMTPNQTPENPPAFPVSNEANVNGQPGMSLRDWFAGQALVAIVSQAKLNKCGDFVADDCLLQHANAPKYAAITAYQFADAMLRAREVRP